jgi:hypothetical protein
MGVQIKRACDQPAQPIVDTIQLDGDNSESDTHWN